MEEIEWVFRCPRVGCGFGCMAQVVMDNHLSQHEADEKEAERLRVWKERHNV